MSILNKQTAIWQQYNFILTFVVDQDVNKLPENDAKLGQLKRKFTKQQQKLLVLFKNTLVTVIA